VDVALLAPAAVSVGVYCMAYVRSILPEEGEPMWDRLTMALSEEREAKDAETDIWRTLGDRTGRADT
jgi:hypothetical protein